VPFELPVIRRNFRFRGNVQGVGFRWTTARVMDNLPLAGFVRNLSDGTVELVLEGDPDEVENGVELLREKMGGQIDDVTSELAPSTGEFSGFSIR
jgi:acylphosphatase